MAICVVKSNKNSTALPICGFTKGYSTDVVTLVPDKQVEAGQLILDNPDQITITSSK